MDVEHVGARGRVHGEPAARRQRAVHDRDGDEDAVRRSRLAKEIGDGRVPQLFGRRGLGAAARRLRAPGRGRAWPSTREDRVYLICRGEHPVIVYDQKGNFVRSWGEGEFTYRTHGITVGPDGTVYCTDDGNHTVRQFTPERQAADDAGHAEHALRHRLRRQGHRDRITPRRAPFNRPTNLAVGPKGDLYVSDGYGNCRVHQFSPTGELKRSWGVPGTGPGRVLPAPRHRGARPTGACSSATGRTTASRSSAPTAST